MDAQEEERFPELIGLDCPPSLGATFFKSDGTFHVDSTLLYLRKRWQLRERLRAEAEQQQQAEQQAGKKKRKKRRKNRQWAILGTSRNSVWYKLYVLNIDMYMDPESLEGENFRRDFRMTAAQYLRLVGEIKAEQWFPDIVDGKRDAVGKESHPLELFVLGALRVLGRYMYFKDLEQLTNMSESSHSQFFKRFVKAGRERLFPKHVSMPETLEEIAAARGEFTRAGLDGAIGSMDCVHIWWDNCPAGASNLHTGKEKYPTRSFEVRALLTCTYFINHTHTHS